MAAAVAVQAVGEHVRRPALAVESVVHHVQGVGVRVGVVVQDEGDGHRQCLMVPIVAADGAIEQARGRRPQEVTLDVPAQVVGVLDR